MMFLVFNFFFSLFFFVSIMHICVLFYTIGLTQSATWEWEKEISHRAHFYECFELLSETRKKKTYGQTKRKQQRTKKITKKKNQKLKKTNERKKNDEHHTQWTYQHKERHRLFPFLRFLCNPNSFKLYTTQQFFLRFGFCIKIYYVFGDPICVDLMSLM